MTKYKDAERLVDAVTDALGVDAATLSEHRFLMAVDAAETELSALRRVADAARESMGAFGSILTSHKQNMLPAAYEGRRARYDALRSALSALEPSEESESAWRERAANGGA